MRSESGLSEVLMRSIPDCPVEGLESNGSFIPASDSLSISFSSIDSSGMEEYKTTPTGPTSEDLDDEREKKDSTKKGSSVKCIPDNLIRFSGAPWFDKALHSKILICGVGGIGSWAAFSIARLNPELISLCDPDTVEKVNAAGQMFGIKDVSKSKVNVMLNTMIAYSGYYKVWTYPIRVESIAEECLRDIMVCGFDNMDARKTAFIRWKKHVSLSRNREECLFIDGRLAAEVFEIFCIRGDDEDSIDKYERQYLFDDKDAAPTVCSYKQTTFSAMMIGGMITNLIVNFLSGEIDSNNELRRVPFYTCYDARTLQLETRNE